MNKRDKKIRIIFLFMSIVIVLLIALIVMIMNKDDSATEEYKEAVKLVESESNNKVSKVTNENNVYYDHMAEYIHEMTTFLKSTFKIVQEESINETNKEQLLAKTNDFILYSEKFENTPITEGDDILHDEFIDMKYDIEMIVEYTLKYTHNQDDVYKTFHRDYYEELLIHMDTLKRIEQQYY